MREAKNGHDRRLDRKERIRPFNQVYTTNNLILYYVKILKSHMEAVSGYIRALG